MRSWRSTLVLGLMGLVATGCTGHVPPGGATPVLVPPVPVSGGQHTPVVNTTPPVAPAVQPPRHTYTPDPSGQYIADIYQGRLQVLDYSGAALAAPTFPADVQLVHWAPKGDRLLVITGKPKPDCCYLYADARYWLLSLPGGEPRELTGIPQEVVFTWAPDEASLYVLDNWRRQAPLDQLGERIQQYDLATGRLALLHERVSRLSSVQELPGGDLLVGQYAGGGHNAYYRLARGEQKLQTVAPFHSTVSPDSQWAVEANLQWLNDLAVANLHTGEVRHYQPNPPYAGPAFPSGKQPGQWQFTDPQWAPDSRWLLYHIRGGDGYQEVRLFDRRGEEQDHVVEHASGMWLPGLGVRALVLGQQRDGTALQPMVYDLTAAPVVRTANVGAPMSGTLCTSGQAMLAAPEGNTAAFVMCSGEQHTLWLLDLQTKRGRYVPMPGETWPLAFAADGKTLAAITMDGGEGQLKLLKLDAD